MSLGYIDSVFERRGRRRREKQEEGGERRGGGEEEEEALPPKVFKFDSEHKKKNVKSHLEVSNKNNCLFACKGLALNC